MDRRTFLKEAAVFSAALSAPSVLSRSAEALGSSKRLVVVELAGGSDGLNTVVPYTSPDYYAARPKLAIPARKVLKLTDTFGFHPALAPLRELYDRGDVAIVQGVGYPNPSRCHVRARAIWHTGCLEAGKEKNDWLADASTVVTDYTDQPLEAALRSVVKAMRADSPTKIFHVRMEGFDTHTNQVETDNHERGLHADLLSRLASGVRAFWDDVRALRQENDVLVMTFSEFGRRVRENATAGTDHGTANPMFFIGAGVKPGFHGEHSELGKGKTDLVGDMVHTVDFRSVYSSVLARWFGVDPVTILGQRFQLIDFV